MNLKLFEKSLNCKKFAVKDNTFCVDVYYSDKLCAKIFMDKDFAYWVDTNIVPIEYRRKLAASVSELAFTPYTKRRNIVIAKHSNHMYVKSIDMESHYNSFTAKVEMTGDADEADRYITPDKSDALAKLFGKEIHYVEVIEQ